MLIVSRKERSVELQRVIKPIGLETELYTLDVFRLVGPCVSRGTGPAIIATGPKTLRIARVQDAPLNVIGQSNFWSEIAPALTTVEDCILIRHRVEKVIVDDATRPIRTNALISMGEQWDLGEAVVVCHGCGLTLTGRTCKHLTKVFLIFGIATAKSQRKIVSNVPIHLTKSRLILGFLLSPRGGKQPAEKVGVLPQVIFTVPHENTQRGAEAVEI